MSAKKVENKKEVVRGKDKWEEDAVLELIYRDPESLTDGDLVSTSLSNLSKNLKPTISAAAIFNVYLRWLEVHRNHPSQLTSYWPNTIVQWVASLKARSFTKEDIVSIIEKWRKNNGPFTSSREWDEPRYPPSDSEIAQAFDGRHIGRKYRTSTSSQGRQRENSPEKTNTRYRERSYDNSRARESRKLGNEAKSVAANYVCNRCGKGGHLLLDCPTNMVEMPANDRHGSKIVNTFQDPSYDKKPPMTYTCSLCEKSGQHWFSLCPKNTSRDSITQKRLAAGIEVPGAKDGEHRRENNVSRMEHREKALPDQRISRSKDSPSSYYDKEVGSNTRTGAIPKEDSKGHKRARPATSRESSEDRVPERASKRKIVSYDDVDTVRRTEDTRFMHSDDERNAPGLVGILRETDPYTDDFSLKNRSRSLTPESPAEFTLSFRGKRMSSGTTSSAEDVRTPEDDREEGFKTPSVREETPEHVYSDFVRNLIAGRTEVVQRMRRRPTALELWDEDDNRRLQAMNLLSIVSTLVSVVIPGVRLYVGCHSRPPARQGRPDASEWRR
ncbi:E3 ubiquitin- ligase RBBP6 protein [Rutstroemia sp. NJR-2017a BBW]|nr:E3 ubiquitin- ligase RBBP6 protein [Rutstroemia sp. NJR-2017a BBW]